MSATPRVMANAAELARRGGFLGDFTRSVAITIVATDLMSRACRGPYVALKVRTLAILDGRARFGGSQPEVDA